ncbi:VOC family protein [Rubellicoccus peritrichatus]|uniref:VOC family protein n=1 Tax=Rubellicoccus peritrichatus TaxID=3080537 RepID=A0AAQ3QRM2_9BACT|nr:VOC family protein [Puniceicoccus sp. CR14]WOO39451.1 VOC family protein [Puniceicoccus sp. CR14]
MSEDPGKGPGFVGWNELMTPNLDESLEFYSKVFGWTFDDWPMPDGMTYKVAMVDNKPVAGIMPRTPDVPADAPPMWTAYINVEDCDATLTTAVEGGATVLYPATDMEGIGRFAVIQDPHGAVIAFIKYKPNC